MASSIVEINGNLFVFIDDDGYIVNVQISANGFSLHTYEGCGEKQLLCLNKELTWK